MSSAEVMKASKWTRHAVASSSRSSGDPSLDKELYQITCEERSKGWLKGPLSLVELAKLLGPLFVINRRFALRQADKVRPIDDYSESFPMQLSVSPFKLDLGAVDGIASLLRPMLQAVGVDRAVSVAISSGEILRGVLHHEFTVEQARTIVGRTLDLDAAYRQLIISRRSSWCSVQATYNPETQAAEFDLSLALPFGASSSVYYFNRFLRTIWLCGVVQFGLP
jgi:hypothetical protein